MTRFETRYSDLPPGVTSNDINETMADPEIKIVHIPACVEHHGIYRACVALEWICPQCGEPRGEVRRVRSYDGSLSMMVDGWRNECGHVDKYSAVRKEARENGLNYA